MKKSKNQKIKILWVTDPWPTLDHSNDTTLRLMQESELLGHQNDWCDLHLFHMPSAQLKSKLKNYDHIFYRVDPPVDLHYLLPLQVIESLKSPKTQIHPSLSLVSTTNEKMIASTLNLKLCPKFLVSSDLNQIQKFIKKHKRVVLKPLNGAQSKGVTLVSHQDVNQVQKIKALITPQPKTQTQIPIMAQEYLPGILKGEKRLWFASHQLIAVALKVPHQQSPIINMDTGSTLAKTKLNPSEKSTALKIGKFIKKKGILFCAVDLIDGKITDFNYTSPGLLVGIEKLYGQNLAKKALEFVLKRALKD